MGLSRAEPSVGKTCLLEAAAPWSWKGATSGCSTDLLSFTAFHNPPRRVPWLVLLSHRFSVVPRPRVLTDVTGSGLVSESSPSCLLEPRCSKKMGFNPFPASQEPGNQHPG
ncbi:uncharacterized protein LOC132686274 [Panthera onca]